MQNHKQTNFFNKIITFFFVLLTVHSYAYDFTIVNPNHVEITAVVHCEEVGTDSCWFFPRYDNLIVKVPATSDKYEVSLPFNDFNPNVPSLFNMKISIVTANTYSYLDLSDVRRSGASINYDVEYEPIVGNCPVITQNPSFGPENIFISFFNNTTDYPSQDYYGHPFITVTE